MKNKISFLFLFLLISSPYAAELICASNFEVAGLNEYFGKYSFNILQSKMSMQPEARQLAAVADVPSGGCSYSLRVKITGALVDVRVVSSKSGENVFGKVYKIKSVDDLPAVFEQLGNALQVYEFEEKEKRKSVNPHLVSSGFSYFSNMGGVLDTRYTYFWNAETFWIETFLSFTNSYRDVLLLNPGVRVLYPFSSIGNTFYIGSGGGFSIGDNYGAFAENSLGYLFWNKVTSVRVETVLTGMFHEEKSIGGGVRIMVNVINDIGNANYKAKEQANKERDKDKDKREKENYRYRFAYASYYLSGYQPGFSLSGGWKGIISINKSTAFEPELNFVMRKLTSDIKTIYYNNGSSHSYDSDLKEGAISIPVLFRHMPFGGPIFYVEGGGQFEFPFGTEIDGTILDSRAFIDIGYVFGIGWNIGKAFSFGFRGIGGITNFDSESREKPRQFELGISF